MAALPFTADDLYAACGDIYVDGEHIPRQLWLDTLGDDLVLIRCSFPEEFCHRCVARLEALRVQLHARHGHEFGITFLIYGSDLEDLGIRLRSELLQELFLPLD